MGLILLLFLLRRVESREMMLRLLYVEFNFGGSLLYAKVIVENHFLLILPAFKCMLHVFEF